MTPPARLQAAIVVLDQYLTGAPLEKALTNWARKSRYAGSKDRAAVRDIVFQSVRCRSSYAAAGGALTGRGLAIGYALANLTDPELAFDGSGYGPEKLSSDEKERFNNRSLSSEPHVKFDFPEWMSASLQNAVGPDLEPVMEKLKQRAPVFVRVNQSKTTRDAAINLLAREGIVAVSNQLAETALEIVENPRKLNNTSALQDGLIELQDAASQAVCQTVPSGSNLRILDYCAGGGGKALALADRPHAEVFAYDINPARMNDIAQRSGRAGVTIKTLTKSETRKHAPYDVVLCDAPCSGSGAWRRAPEGKWSFTAQKLGELLDIQSEILNDAAELVSPNGILIYATCSMLREENEDRTLRFLSENPGWTQAFSKRFSPLDGGDGFFVAHLTRENLQS